MQTPKARFATLEAGRGIAAILVALHHVCMFAFASPPHRLSVPMPSGLAVLYFFTLSGAVMGLAHPPGSPSLKAAALFLLRRATRIYPLLWLMTAAVLWQWPFMNQPENLWRWLSLVPQTDAQGHQRFGDALGPAWSLHWEILFYLLFALGLALPFRRLLFTAWALAILLCYPLPPSPTLPAALQQAIFVIINPLGLFFLAGIVAAAACRHHRLGLNWGRALLALGLCAFAYYCRHADFGVALPTRNFGFRVTAIGLGCFTAGLLILERHFRAPPRAWCLLLGKLSFPLYISHWLTIQLVGRFFWLHHFPVAADAYAFAAASAAAALLGAILVMRLLDQPLQSFFKRLFSPRPGTIPLAQH